MAGEHFCHVTAHGKRVWVQAPGTVQWEPHPPLTAGGLPPPLEQSLYFSLLLTFFLLISLLRQGLLRVRGSRAGAPLHLPLPFRPWSVWLVHAQHCRQSAKLMPFSRFSLVYNALPWRRPLFGQPLHLRQRGWADAALVQGSLSTSICHT